jgi:hypothetical protein
MDVDSVSQDTIGVEASQGIGTLNLPVYTPQQQGRFDCASPLFTTLLTSITLDRNAQLTGASRKLAILDLMEDVHYEVSRELFNLIIQSQVHLLTLLICFV